MMWLQRRRMEALQGAALFESLTDRDQQVLDAWRRRHPDAVTEFDSLRRTLDFVASADAASSLPPVDLAMAIRREINVRRAAVKRPTWLAYTPALSAACILILALAWVFTGFETPGAVSPGVLIARQDDPSPPVLALMDEANALAAQGDYATACQVLMASLESYPEGVGAGAALEMLARLRFDQLHDYEGSYKNYLDLRDAHPGVFAADTKNADRLDLLDESEADGYSALRLYDAARSRRGPEGYDALERVVASASTQAPHIARLAMDEMVARVQGEPYASGNRIDALRVAKDRCANPVAQACLTIQLARAYWTERGDLNEARRLGEETLRSNEPYAVAMAQDLLAELSRDAE